MLLKTLEWQTSTMAINTRYILRTHISFQWIQDRGCLHANNTLAAPVMLPTIVLVATAAGATAAVAAISAQLFILNKHAKHRLL